MSRIFAEESGTPSLKVEVLIDSAKAPLVFRSLDGDLVGPYLKR